MGVAQQVQVPLHPDVGNCRLAMAPIIVPHLRQGHLTSLTMPQRR